MKMNEHIKKFLKHTAITAGIVGGVFFAAAADAGYVVYRYNNEGNNGIPMGISQADAARIAKSFERIGECEAYEDACLAAFVDYYNPKDLLNIKTMSAKDKEARRKWLGGNPDEQVKKYVAARTGKAMFSESYPQPYSAGGMSDKHQNLSRYGRSIGQMGGGNYFPYGFNITDGEAVFANGKMDADKTKFVGRYEDILPVAVYNGVLYDAAGLLNAIAGKQSKGNSLDPLVNIFINANSNIYLKNAEGKEVLTPQDKGPVSEYALNRFQRDLPPQDTIEEMNSKYSRIHYDEAWIKNTMKKLVNGALASPVSRAPVRPARGNLRAG
jgi:hypothetical protein